MTLDDDAPEWSDDEPEPPVWAEEYEAATHEAPLRQDEPPEPLPEPLPPPPLEADGPAPRDPWRTVRGASLWARPLAPPEYLVPGLDLGRGRPNGLVGGPGAGKTDIAQGLALAVMTGRKAWGMFECRRGRVLHITYDLGEYAVRLRYRRLANGMGVDAAELADRLEICAHPEYHLDTWKNDLGVAAGMFAHRMRGFDLVIVDHLRAVAPEGDENDSGFGAYVTALGAAAAAAATTLLYLHHTGKDGGGSGRGTGAIQGASGAIWRAEGQKSEPRHLTQVRVSDNSNGEADDFWIVRTVLPGPGAFHTGGEPSWRDEAMLQKPKTQRDEKREREKAVVAWVVAHPGCSKNAVREGVKGKSVEVDAALEACLTSGEVEDRGDERGMRLYANAH